MNRLIMIAAVTTFGLGALGAMVVTARPSAALAAGHANGGMGDAALDAAAQRAVDSRLQTVLRALIAQHSS